MTTAQPSNSSAIRPAVRRLWSLFIQPRQTLGEVTTDEKPNWLVPLLILSATSAIAVVANGLIRRQIALAGEIALPPDFQWYTPEQQAQYMQAAQSINGPVFLFVLPLLAALLKLWLGWLVVGGLLHLGLTLMGGRGAGGQALNLAAWASLPFGLRDLLRAVVVLGSRSLIDAPGLAGFVPAGEGFGLSFLAALLGMTDLFLIWHVVLLILGALAYTGLARTRVLGGALLSRLLPMALFALALAGLSQLGSLTFIRPFF
ncbi:MAG: YIP1 family protein [Chloroflexi bacterium]|nr:YIP1 family protein [Chloroflexota bacterium]